MCSWEVFLDTWPEGAMSSNSICSGVLPRTRASWVSVSTLVGIRFKSRICSGRMSWVMARVSVMTKIFSLRSVRVAGS